MTQLLGFEIQEDVRKVYKLNKSLYGLKQSPQAWFDKFSKIITQYELRQCKIDHSVFTMFNDTGTNILVIYIDDIVITGDDVAGIS